MATPSPEYRDVRITGSNGVRFFRFRKQADGSERFVGEIMVEPPPHLPPAAVSILPDGRYLCDAGAFDMPELPAGPGYTGSLDDWLREHGGMTAGDLRTPPGGE